MLWEGTHQPSLPIPLLIYAIVPVTVGLSLSMMTPFPLPVQVGYYVIRVLNIGLLHSLIVRPLFTCLLHHYCLHILYTTNFLIKMFLIDCMVNHSLSLTGTYITSIK